MSDTLLREGSQKWRRQLDDFVAKIRSPLPTAEELSPVQDWHRRITGGLIIQFFEFLENSANEEIYPQLEAHPLHERVFLCVTDDAGFLAARELMNTDSVQAICLRKEEWRAFLEDPDTDDDDDFVDHYQFWSVWHQDIPENWDVAPLEPGYSYWIHEEGFALADGAGRGAQHLWRWDGEELTLQEEVMTSWTS